MNQVLEERSVGLKNSANRAMAGACDPGSCELFNLQLPARAEYLGKTREALTSVAEQLHLTTEDACDLMLAVGEACNNAVQHGSNSARAALQVRCLLDSRSDAGKSRAVRVLVANSGNGFLPVKSDRVFLMPEAEDLAGHGRGLPLMRELMDDVQVFCENGNTVVRLTKKISA